MPDEYPPIEARGVDLEIWEPAKNALGIIAPYRFKINGVEVLGPDRNPDGSSTIIKLGDVSRKEGLTATMTVFVRSLTIHGGENASP
jgi:hypothetical protein